MAILTTYNDSPPPDDGSETANNTVTWAKIKEELTDPLKNWIENPDLDGNELLLDADGDTSIHADTDDQIDIKIAGSDEYRLNASALFPVTDSANDLGTSSLKFADVHTDAINGGAPCRIATGTYTGDGAVSQAITGLGFQPKFVQITERKTGSGNNVPLFFTDDVTIDDNASGMAITFNTSSTRFESITNAIISLDSDGFTVDDAGTDSNPK